MKLINYVKFLGLVFVILSDSLFNNFCIFPLSLDGESVVFPINPIENRLANLYLYISDVFLAIFKDLMA